MKQNNQFDNDRIRIQESIESDYEKLTLANDFMFGKVMQDERNCIGMLERLTGNEIGSVKTVVEQKVIKVTNDSKGVRYDIYVEDDKDNVYDAEMQRQKAGQESEILPKRARFYQGMIDLNLLETGGLYEELKSSYVIFICTFDPFGKGLSCYTFENICLDDKDLPLNDGRKILFFNTKADNINVSEEAARFLKYLETNETSDDYTAKLKNDVALARLNREWRVEYMKTLLHDMDVRNEGRKEIIINILEEYGEVTEDLRMKIYSEHNIKTLTKWAKLAATVSSIDEFEEKINSME